MKVEHIRVPSLLVVSLCLAHCLRPCSGCRKLSPCLSHQHQECGTCYPFSSQSKQAASITSPQVCTFNVCWICDPEPLLKIWNLFLLSTSSHVLFILQPICSCLTIDRNSLRLWSRLMSDLISKLGLGFALRRHSDHVLPIALGYLQSHTKGAPKLLLYMHPDSALTWYASMYFSCGAQSLHWVFS